MLNARTVRIGSFLALLSTAVGAEGPAGEPPPRYRIVPERSTVGFDATSTLHDFTGKTKAVSGSIEADLSDLAPAKGRIVVDARTLDTQDKGRDKDMHEDHLHSQEHPSIVFTLDRVEELRWSEKGRKASFILVGTLSLHGKTREIRIPAKGETVGDGFRAEGEVALKMSDFAIKPPSTFLIFRVADAVRVWFTIETVPEKKEEKK